jgi:hypothetical protein
VFVTGPPDYGNTVFASEMVSSVFGDNCQLYVYIIRSVSRFSHGIDVFELQFVIFRGVVPCSLVDGCKGHGRMDCSTLKVEASGT